MENGASDSDGKAAHNDSQVRKCYLCDENHKRINCSQNKTEHSKKNWKIQSCFKCGKGHETRFCDQNSHGSKIIESNAFIRGETERDKYNDHFIVPVYCNNVECKALRDSGSSICLERRLILGTKLTRQVIQ